MCVIYVTASHTNLLIKCVKISLIIFMVEIKKRTEYSIRAMQERDIPQVLEIDREAFPTQWPYPTYTSFKQELQNKLARYIIAYKPNDEDSCYPAENTAGNKTFLDKIMNIFSPAQSARNTILPPGRDHIMGMSGFWLMAGEVHIITIAVRNQFRNQGIGSRMLIQIMESAIALNARMVTLEVRMSNTIAQQVYKKFGFKPAGIRHKYYTDNNENALIMTTDDVNNPNFLSRLQFLEDTHRIIWGEVKTE